MPRVVAEPGSEVLLQAGRRPVSGRYACARTRVGRKALMAGVRDARSKQVLEGPMLRSCPQTRHEY